MAEAGREALDGSGPSPSEAGERDAHDVAAGRVLAERRAEARDERARPPAPEAPGHDDGAGRRVRRHPGQRGDRSPARRAALAPALREAVPARAATGVDDVELFGRAVQAEVVAAVLGDEQPATVRRGGEPVGIAQPSRLDPQAAAAGPERDHGAGHRRRRALVVGLASDAQVEPPAGTGHDRVDAVPAHRQPVDDDARAPEAAPVEARVGHHAAGVPGREGRVRDDVADVELAPVPREPERAEEPAHDLARPRPAPRHQPDPVGIRRLHARGRGPQPAAAVERQVRRVRDPLRVALELHTRRYAHPRRGRRGGREQHEQRGGEQPAH